jgi:hypothetical protein
MAFTSDGVPIDGWVGDGSHLWTVRVEYVVSHDAHRDTGRLQAFLTSRYEGRREWGVGSGSDEHGRPFLQATLHVAADEPGAAVRTAVCLVEDGLNELGLLPLEIGEVCVMTPIPWTRPTT